MDPSGDIAAILAALADPGFYPGRPERVERLETHISWVFLAGDLAYKLKKPVRFPFLDYGTRERRLELCREEVRLNRGLAPGLYLGVRSIVPADGGWALGPADDPSAREHLVEMRRFDEDRTLARALADGRADPELLAAVGRRLARFHSEVPPVQAGDGPGRVAREVDDNVEELIGLGAVPAPELAASQRFFAAFLASREAELDRRAAEGRVRDCHGDLRAEHVLVSGEIQAFDCVEFDPGLRQIDVAADLAFLVMDLAHTGHAVLVDPLVEGYTAAGGDPGDRALLAFFASYRAWVRAKVDALRSAELDPADPERDRLVAGARALAALGRRFAWLARGPVVIAICGGAASGKTHLARYLAGISGLERLSSDVVRKELLGLEPTERAPESAYSPEMDARTYEELAERAADELAAGRGAVVDATFRRRSERERFVGGLGGAHSLFVQCTAPPGVLAERAAARAREPERVSDAAGDIIERQRREFEPLDEVHAEDHLALRTDRPVEEVAADLEAVLDERLALSAGRDARPAPSRGPDGPPAR